MNLPIDLTGVDAAEIDNLEAAFTALQHKFVLDFSTTTNPKLKRFDSMSCYDDVNNYLSYSEGGIIKISTPVNECYLVFIKLCSHEHKTTRWAMPSPDAYSFRVKALVKQQKDFGRALIRKETFTDRLLSVIHPVELKFDDDKAFSKKYYVIANDAEKAKSAMNWNFRNTIMGIELVDTWIESDGKDLLIGDNDWLSPESTLRMAEIGCKLASASH